MVSREEYNQFIQSIISGEEKEILDKNQRREEKLRKIQVVSFSILMVGLFIVMIVFFLSWGTGFVFKIMYMPFLLFLICVPAMFISISIGAKNARDVEAIESRYKDQIIEFLLKGQPYSFDRKGTISQKVLIDSGMANSGRIDEYKCSDKLTLNIPNDNGSASQTNITLCDIRATYTTTDSDGKTDTTVVYDGIFGVCELPFRFKSTLAINTSYKSTKKMEKVVLEDVNFNNKIRVACDDQIEARYILTPEVMMDLLNLKKRMGEVKIVLSENLMYVGFPSANLFSKRHDKSKNGSLFYYFYDDIEVLMKFTTKIAKNNKVFKM